MVEYYGGCTALVRCPMARPVEETLLPSPNGAFGRERTTSNLSLLPPELFSDRLLAIPALGPLGIYPRRLCILHVTFDSKICNVQVLRKFEQQLLDRYGLIPNLVENTRITTSQGFLGMNTQRGTGDVSL